MTHQGLWASVWELHNDKAQLLSPLLLPGAESAAGLVGPPLLQDSFNPHTQAVMPTTQAKWGTQ